ncbi:MAG TPA: glycosyl hydrolase family 18 protein [Candidatus Limnocylindrales bacterium]|nr:glycosyl hydrolase family 18 protein [Candidatus Limnocylindrales bacterium]
MTRRPVAAVVLCLLAFSIGLAIAAPRSAPADGARGGAAGQPSSRVTNAPSRSPIPIPGHEVYGFVPYWEMDPGIADHLAATELTTIGLFSVTHGKNGALSANQNGYRRILGPTGERIIREAHDRGVRTELVYTSFGERKNDAFFGNDEARARTIDELVALAKDLGMDGINVDVELLGVEHIPAYGDFVGRLRAAVREAIADGEVSVATTANQRGAAMARAASLAGADRIFMMGYDYRVGGSEPGASAPLERRDGSDKDLGWSLDLYRDAGVPPERTILGLPLYGMVWPVTGPELGAASTGRGEIWVPRRNLATIESPEASPAYDDVEDVTMLAVPNGDSWQSVYYDTPASLTPKLAAADERGLAGAGFWAVGYERGLPEYTQLIASFRAGQLAATAP